MAKSQATTMKIRNRNGLIHAAFSTFDTAEGPFASATPRSLVTRFHRQINPLDKYCLGVFLRQNLLRVVPAKAGTHTPRLVVLALGVDIFGNNQSRWLWVPAFAGTASYQAGCCAGERNRGALFLPNAAADFPVNAASTSATICARRWSLASFVKRSRPKITLKVALFDR